MPSTSASASAPPWRRDLLVLIFVVGALNLFVLGRLPLANPDEGRYAQIPREMLAAGDWVTPRLNGIPYFEKPPLVYWAVGAAISVFGPGEFAVRLVPALFGLAGVLLTYAAARRLYGRGPGMIAALVLATTLLYFGLSRILLLDMAVSVLMAAALFCFLLGVREPPGARRRWLFYGLYTAAALATLTKGLIGFLIPGAVMFFWLLIFNQWHRLRPFYLPSGVLLFLAIAAPWHLLAAQRNPGWAEFYFVREHWDRFTKPGHGRFEPWYYFLIWFPALFFPWTIFVGQAVREAVAGGWARRKANADAWFLITWAGFVFLFFSNSQSKLLPYILPMFPPLAVLIGSWLARRWGERNPPGARGGFRAFAFLCGLLGVAILVAVFRPGVIRDPEQALALRPYAIALATILLVGGIAAGATARARSVAAGVATLLATMAGFFLVLALAAPGFQRPGTKEIAELARERVRPGDRVFHYWAFFHDFVYYSQQPVGLVNYSDELQVTFLDPAERAQRFISDAELQSVWAGSTRIWLVARKRDTKALFAEPAFRYHLIGETRWHYLLSNQP